MKISVVIPVYNEVTTIEEIITRVHAAPYEKEIIIVDDGSTDGTRQILENPSMDKDIPFKVFYHERNRGKGVALNTGFHAVTGDIIIIQDADLELDPMDYPKLLGPIFDGRAEVVYGSRFLERPRQTLFSWHYMGNRFLTLLSNALMNLRLSDMETGYKVFTRKVLHDLRIKSKRFGFEPEFTAKVAKKRFRISEVPIHYNARTHKEGKKITWRDGIIAVFAIIWFRIFD
ncbi:MAG: glycosyltransferase family 2 protein [Pseudomonadota bacterium]